MSEEIELISHLSEAECRLYGNRIIDALCLDTDEYQLVHIKKLNDAIEAFVHPVPFSRGRWNNMNKSIELKAAQSFNYASVEAFIPRRKNLQWTRPEILIFYLEHCKMMLFLKQILQFPVILR